MTELLGPALLVGLVGLLTRLAADVLAFAVVAATYDPTSERFEPERPQLRVWRRPPPPPSTWPRKG